MRFPLDDEITLSKYNKEEGWDKLEKVLNRMIKSHLLTVMLCHDNIGELAVDLKINFINNGEGLLELKSDLTDKFNWNSNEDRQKFNNALEKKDNELARHLRLTAQHPYKHEE